MVGSLGVVTTNPGTPVRITANAPTQRTDAKNFPARSVRIQADTGNSVVVWVGLAGMEGSPSGPQLLGVIGKPAAATDPRFDFFEIDCGPVPGLNLYDIFVDSVSTPASVIVSYTA